MLFKYFFTKLENNFSSILRFKDNYKKKNKIIFKIRKLFYYL